MQARMKNPAMVLPETLPPIHALRAAIEKTDLPPKTLALAHLRASQINGCSFCVDMGHKAARQADESEERLAAVAAWRHAPFFTDAERAALALTEAVTRIADSSDPVPDAVWDEARQHYDDQALSALLLTIGLTNLFNRINVATRMVAGAWKP